MTTTYERALRQLSRGGMIVVTDDEDRENEGDLVMAARYATVPRINFMIKHGRGLICVPMEESRARDLDLSRMCETNTDPHRTAFTVSVDALSTTTGISAEDRTRTIRALAGAAATGADFRKPGHLFPLTAKPGGLSERRGHTEASVSLVRQISENGEPAVAVICEILSRDGSMKRGADLTRFCLRHRLPRISVREIAKQDLTLAGTESTIVRRVETKLPTRHGTFRLFAYEDRRSGKEHLALVRGEPSSTTAPLCRIHSECLTGDVLGSQRCDCGAQLNYAMDRVNSAGNGVILYLRQEGRGIGLVNKIRAYALQDTGVDTVDANLMLGFPADARDYRAAAEILHDLGIAEVSLMTNNPAKISGLERFGITVRERFPVIIEPGPDNSRYLHTKMTRMDHQLAIKEGIHERV